MGLQLLPNMEHHPKCTVIQSRAATYLLTKLRQKDLGVEQFQTIGDRLMRLLGEEALARLPTVVEGEVQTPCGVAGGYVDTPGPPVCVVSIVRSGDILQEAVRYLQPGVSVGKILIQRDESKPDKPAVLYYKKLPKNISDSFVILVDPMLATGGSAIRALTVLKVNKQAERPKSRKRRSESSHALWTDICDSRV